MSPNETILRTALMEGLEFITSLLNRRDDSAIDPGGYGWEYVEEDFTGPDCPGCVNPGSLCNDCEYINN